MPQNEGKQIVKPRLIDFETYKREVEQLQRRALSPKSASHDNNTKEKFTTEEPELISPLSPAIVLASLEDIAHLESPPMEPVQTKQFSSVFNHQRNGFVPPKSADSEDFSLPPPQVYRREVYENIEVFKKEQTTKPRRQQNTASTVDIPITFVVEPTIEGGGGGKAAVQIPVEIVDSSAVQIQHETTRRIFSEKPPPRRYLERYILREEELPEVPIGEIIDDEKPAPEPGEPEFEEEFEEKVSDPDRRLLETLNRELQYEEKVGYEVRKKKRRPGEEGEHSSDGALAIDDEEEENTKGKEEKAAEATLSLSSEGGDEEQTEFEEVEERIQRVRRKKE
jgi:hypothetical protein